MIKFWKTKKFFSSVLIIFLLILFVSTLNVKAKISTPTQDWELPLGLYATILGFDKEDNLITMNSSNASKISADGTVVYSKNLYTDWWAKNFEDEWIGYESIAKNDSDWIFWFFALPLSSGLCKLDLEAFDDDFYHTSIILSESDSSIENNFDCYDSYFFTEQNSLYVSNLQYNYTWPFDPHLYPHIYLNKTYLQKYHLFVEDFSPGYLFICENSWNSSYNPSGRVSNLVETEDGNVFVQTATELFLFDSNTGEEKWVRNFEHTIINLKVLDNKALISYYEGEKFNSTYIFELYDKSGKKLWVHKLKLEYAQQAIGMFDSYGSKICFIRNEYSDYNYSLKTRGIYVLDNKGILQTKLLWDYEKYDYFFGIKAGITDSNNSFYYIMYNVSAETENSLNKYSYKVSKIGSFTSIGSVITSLCLLVVLRKKKKR
ncbi:MAG: hypothetical protein V3V41_04545 [Candidatus Heimdallarchaeota archaeon]